MYDKKGVALIEAGLKASGRRRGYAIQSRHTKDVLVKCLGEGPTGPCKWQVRLVPAPNNHGHTISEIDPNHQCDPTLVLPGSNLKRVLDFFVSDRVSVHVIIQSESSSHALAARGFSRSWTHRQIETSASPEEAQGP